MHRCCTVKKKKLLMPPRCENSHPPFARRYLLVNRSSSSTLSERVRSTLGVAPAAGLSPAGGASKISDFKPMLAHLFPAFVRGCDFWGYMQVVAC